jgi:hypothetical protein
MTDEGHAPRWRVVGASVRGASHERSGLPNQDAIHWLPESGAGPWLILALADGHGSVRCFRSDVGSRLAVETAAGVLREFLENLPDPLHLSVVKRWSEENLPQELVHRWRAAVADHVSDHPLTNEELDRLEEQRDVEGRRQVALEPILAYGATLLTVLVTERFILYLQLGDGDILAVSDAGEVSRPPLPADARLFANQTTSLCSEDAWREVRHHFQVLSGSPPALILVSTDGYSNSFRDEAGFQQVGADILDMVRAEGLDSVAQELEGWLDEASRSGSGDDVTLGIVCRTDALRPVSTEAEEEEAPDEDMPVGRVPAGHLSSVREEEGVVLARCSRSGADFGIRFEEKRHGRWEADWAFAIKSRSPKRERYGRRVISGAFDFDAEYPGCPHCGEPSIFQCVCGRVACWDGKQNTVTCPWCGKTLLLRDSIGSLDARADR